MNGYPIPSEIEQIYPGWLTAALRQAGALSGAAVSGFDAEVVGQEWGFTGVVARLRLRYDRAEACAPRTLIAKLPGATRAVGSSYLNRQPHPRSFFERCAREVWFYRDVCRDTSCPAPRMYYGAADVDAGRVVLLLEDLSGAEQGDALLGCDASDLEQILRRIAPLHAAWWERRPGTVPGWLPAWGGDPEQRQRRYVERSGRFLAAFGRRVPGPVRSLVERLDSRYGAVLTRLAVAPRTLIHADLHLDNVLFDRSGPQPLPWIIDWQGVSIGAAAVDVALLLYGSLEVDERRAAEAALLRGYHQRLTRLGVSGYPYDRLVLDCRLALLWQLGGTVTWLGSIDRADLAGRERALVEAIFDEGRLFAALVDHEVARLL